MAQEQSSLTRDAPGAARSEIDWRHARAKIEHEHYMSLRRARHEAGPAHPLWDLSENDLRERAHEHAVRACVAAIARMNERIG